MQVKFISDLLVSSKPYLCSMYSRFILIVFLFCFGVTSKASDPVRNYSGMVSFLTEYLNIKYQHHQFNEFLYVAVKQQKMFYIVDNQVVGEYKISTAENGLGSSSGSHKTPPGLHIIREKVGADVPLGGIIKEKVFTGAVSRIEPKPVSLGTDIITTRLFHLGGMEPGINKNSPNDSYSRGIMIHGTPEEGLIGQPVSHGCVRMMNEDIMQLYDRINTGTFVVILNN